MAAWPDEEMLMSLSPRIWPSLYQHEALAKNVLR